MIATRHLATQTLNNICQDILLRAIDPAGLSADQIALGNGSTNLVKIINTLSVSAELGNDWANAVTANATALGNSSPSALQLYKQGYASNPNSHAIVIFSDSADHLTGTTLLDDNGQPVLAASGTAAVTPLAYSADFSADRGRNDSPLYSGPALSWTSANAVDPAFPDPEAGVLVSPAELTKAAVEAELKFFTPLTNFGIGNVWDAQRYNGIYTDQFRETASIYIGIYAAAAGIPLNMIEEIQNDYAAANSTFAQIP